ncbi:MAG: hypothetical protein IJO46_11285 [Thermoguttaceae bacterium]|nr:hypothetical protein [Thermoguttaceae bacterium]MBQ8286053.1 hypothetical protein [Thermoguttaceae bacterium]MBQ9127574.1 hypothetical protein [Thermoguttaceae bacterium]
MENAGGWGIEAVERVSATGGENALRRDKVDVFYVACRRLRVDEKFLEYSA